MNESQTAPPPLIRSIRRQGSFRCQRVATTRRHACWPRNWWHSLHLTARPEPGAECPSADSSRRYNWPVVQQRPASRRHSRSPSWKKFCSWHVSVLFDFFRLQQLVECCRPKSTPSQKKNLKFAFPALACRQPPGYTEPAKSKKKAAMAPKPRHIALLRGINVGGHAIISMSDLRDL